MNTADLLLRERARWPDPKLKGTDTRPYPHLTGWCGPSFPLGHDSHTRCSGRGPDSPSRGVLRCICPCHLVATQGRINDTLQRPEVATALAPWTWEADAAAEIMLQEDATACPMCGNAWESHDFRDDGRVACDMDHSPVVVIR